MSKGTSPFVTGKLHDREDFARVYERGSRWRGRFLTGIALPNELGLPRLGIAASLKIGNAVARNKAKRRVRELFRAHKPLVAIDIVLMPRRELLSAAWVDLENDYRNLLERLEKAARRLVPGP